MIRWGVSPAWFISRYGGGFGPAEIEQEIPRIQAAGFESFQLEIFGRNSIGLWEAGGVEAVHSAVSSTSLTVEVLVAHCLLNGLGSADACKDKSWAAVAKRIARLVDRISTIQTVVVPLPAFGGNPLDADSRIVFLDQWSRLKEPFSQGKVRIAVEVLPDSMGGTEDRLNWMMERPEFADVGLNLDTGHFHAAGFDIPELIRRHRIYATHICDNDGITNDSRPPGRGTVPWSEVFTALDASSYRGPWDLEIMCGPEQIETVYRNALDSCIALTGDMRIVNTEGV